MQILAGEHRRRRVLEHAHPRAGAASDGGGRAADDAHGRGGGREERRRAAAGDVAAMGACRPPLDRDRAPHGSAKRAWPGATAPSRRLRLLRRGLGFGDGGRRRADARRWLLARLDRQFSHQLGGAQSSFPRQHARVDSWASRRRARAADALRPNSPIMSTRYGNSPTSPSRAFADFGAAAAGGSPRRRRRVGTVDAAEQAEMLVVDDNPPPRGARARAPVLLREPTRGALPHLYSLGAKSAYAAPVAKDAPTRAWLH